MGKFGLCLFLYQYSDPDLSQKARACASTVHFFFVSGQIDNTSGFWISLSCTPINALSFTGLIYKQHWKTCMSTHFLVHYSCLWWLCARARGPKHLLTLFYLNVWTCDSPITHVCAPYLHRETISTYIIIIIISLFIHYVAHTHANT